jgi:hypothetical protein
MSETIINYIKQKRPTIGASSLKTYESILRNLYDKLDFDTKGYNMGLFDTDSDKVLEYLKKIEPKKRKTVLSALVVITDNKDYRNLMLDDIKEYNKEEAKQTKTKSPEDNWVEMKSCDDTNGDGFLGFVHQAVIDQYLKKHDSPEDIEFYFCGPPMMNNAVVNMCDQWGVPKENVRFDDFGG